MDLHLLQPKICQSISSVEHLQVELLMLYGDSRDIGEGKHYTSLTRQGLKRLIKDMHHVQQHLKALRSSYLIDADGKIVLTVGHKNNHLPILQGASHVGY